jgi:glycosyltransferase involved in cell wall biosynthesis
VIHANSGYRGFETALVGISLGRRFGVPVVYDVRSFLEATWTPDIHRSESGEHYRLRRQRERSCMEAADLVFTIASTMRDEIASRGINPDKIVVIPNAVDAEDFVPRAADALLVRQFGFSGKTVLGYISNVGRREGIDILVEAVSLLVRQGRTDIACLIVGDGPELPAVRELITERGLATFVHAVGQVPHSEIQRYYSVIDVFVVPRRDDEAARLVTPLKPFEAMAMERPLLVADLPALTEVTGDGARGRTFTPESPASLAAEAQRLVAAPRLREELAVAGRQWVAKERSWAANGRRYVEAYARLNGGGQR